MFRSWLAILTALLLGASLAAPTAAGDGGYEEGHGPSNVSLSVATDTGGGLFNGTDTDSEDGQHPVPLTSHGQRGVQPPSLPVLTAFATGFVELPPARASPAYL